MQLTQTSVAADASAPRVSVVMPVFNGERYIAEAVASVLASSFHDFELIVVDDGSTDGSLAEVARVAVGDPRVRVLRLSRGGVGAAREAGLRAARGELIANLDADDAMFADRLALQVAHLERHAECVAVGSRVLVVDADGNPVRIIVRLFAHADIDAAHMAGRGGAIWNPAAMFRRAAAIAVGGYRAHLDRTGEDHDLWLRLAEAGQLYNLPDVLIRYRIHGSNSSISDDDRQRRLAVTLGNVTDAFARRGITNRTPLKQPSPPLAGWERLNHRALVQYFRGRRASALLPALAALILQPGSPATRSTVRTVLMRKAPLWQH